MAALEIEALRVLAAVSDGLVARASTSPPFDALGAKKPEKSGKRERLATKKR